MFKFFSVSAAVALLVYTISGLVPLKYVPHDHILLGFVTPEQLAQHEKEESLGVQNQDEAQVPPWGSSRLALAGTRGLIISVAPVLAGLVSALHVELALQFGLVLLVPLSYGSIAIPRVITQIVILPSPDPPPRPINTPL
jgi:hypothetical protein